MLQSEVQDLKCDSWCDMLELMLALADALITSYVSLQGPGLDFGMANRFPSWKSRRICFSESDGRTAEQKIETAARSLLQGEGG